MRSPKYVVVLTLVACLILVVGWLARPRDLPKAQAPVPSETELEQLARRTERRSLESMTKYFAGIAGEVSPSLAYIPSAGVTGIVWDQQRVISAPLSEPRPSGTVTLTASSGDATVTPDLWGPNLPLTVLRTPPRLGTLAVAPRASSPPQPGDWIVAVWRTDGPQAFAAANFRQLTPTGCGQSSVTEVVSSLSLTRSMVGGGVFTLEGHLLGVILPCRDHIAAIETASIDAMLERVDTVGQRLLARYGFVVAPLSSEEALYFTVAGGLLVREVWNGSRADDAGVWPGDIITGVGDQPVGAIDDLRALTISAGTSFDVVAQRGTKTVKFALMFGPQPARPTGEPIAAGLTLEPAPQTDRSYRIESVVSGSQASRAGLAPGDRLVRVDRSAPRTLQQAQRILSTKRSSPMLLEVEREGRRIAIVIPSGDAR